jgi:hypothetical protein
MVMTVFMKGNGKKTNIRCTDSQKANPNNIQYLDLTTYLEGLEIKTEGTF